MSDKPELTLESLALEVASLRDENKAKNEQLTAQTALLDANNNKLAEQQQQLDAVLQINQKLTTQLAGFAQGSITLEDSKKRPSLPADPTFTVGGGKAATKYRLLAPVMNIPEIGHITAEEVLMNPAAQKKLVELKSGLIKEVI